MEAPDLAHTHHSGKVHRNDPRIEFKIGKRRFTTRRSGGGEREQEKNR
jgi:hypothetical protein